MVPREAPSLEPLRGVFLVGDGHLLDTPGRGSCACRAPGLVGHHHHSATLAPRGGDAGRKRVRARTGRVAHEHDLVGFAERALARGSMYARAAIDDDDVVQTAQVVDETA